MKRNTKHGEVYVAVISHKRSHGVQSIQSKCGNVTWFVGHGEAEDYLSEGAKNVIESGGLCESRNAALSVGFKECDLVIELSDDLNKLQIAESKKKTSVLHFDSALEMIYSALNQTGARLAGVAPTSNAFYFNPAKPLQTNGFIVGDFIAVKKTELRFDESMRLKEDYDYTLQHLRKYGVVARLNNILASFSHRTNKGGACSYRTSKLEQEMISHLKNKWPGMIRDNPRRPDEILLK